MSSNSLGLGQSAFAILSIIFITFFGSSQHLRFIGAYLHQAFWCSIVETAVGCPAEVITYFMRSKSRIPPSVLQKLDQFIAFLWCGMTVRIVVQSVQPFIVHASLSPYIAAVSRATGAPWETLAQAVVLLCVLQVIHSVSLFVRRLQSTLQHHADRSHPNTTPEQVPLNHLHVLSAVHGLAGHLYTTAALYLEEIAVGMLMTSIKIEYRKLDGREYWAFTLATRAVLLAAEARSWRRALEWDAEGDELAVDRPGRRRGWQQTAFEEMVTRMFLRNVWALDDLLQGLVPWRVPQLGRWWCCPELAVLWPRVELRQFYVDSLSGFSSLTHMAPWSHDAIREHVNLLRRAGIIRNFVLRDYSAIPTRLPTEWLGDLYDMLLSKIIVVLVWFLEATLAWFFTLAMAVAFVLWSEPRKAEELKLRRA